MTKDEKELIDEKFKSLTTLLNARFENVDDRLERIEEQTKKTNGRVTALEHKELTHTISCPQAPLIKEIKDELNEYYFIKKYPKLILYGVILITAGIIFNFISIFII